MGGASRNTDAAFGRMMHHVRLLKEGKKREGMWKSTLLFISLNFSVSKETELFLLDGDAPPINGKGCSMDKVRFLAGQVHRGFGDLSREGNATSRKRLS